MKIPFSLAFALALGSALTAFARETINLNCEWKFLLGDHSGAEAPAFDAAKWSDIHLPHSFSLPNVSASPSPTKRSTATSSKFRREGRNGSA